MIKKLTVSVNSNGSPNERKTVHLIETVMKRQNRKSDDKIMATKRFKLIFNFFSASLIYSLIFNVRLPYISA